MPSDPEKIETKAGHPPAVKVGNMRIVQNKPVHEKQAEAVVADNEEDQEEQAEVPESPPKSVISISGAPARGNQDFPQSAVKAFHEKTPAPSKELRPVTKNHAINQPKK